jgi:hypothetical protein
MYRLTPILLAFFFQVACSVNPSNELNTKLITYENIPWSENECSLAGGEWTEYPVGKFHYCSIKSVDYQQECTDNSQCQGTCEVKNATVKSGDMAAGQCSLYVVYPGGCPKYLVDGKVVQESCI